MKTLTRIPVDSSMLSAVGYDEEKQVFYAEFSRDGKIYAEKYGTPTDEDFAFIAINGEQVRLRMQDFQIDNEARTRKVVYANDNYEVTVDLQETKRADQEVMVNTGTLTLKTQEGKTVEQEVYGVCGC